MAHMIVEQSFETPYTDEAHMRDGTLLDACLQAHGATWVRTYLSVDRLRMVCEFTAPDAEAVRESYRNAGLRFERVWVAETYAAAAGGTT